MSWLDKLSEGLKKTADVISGPLITYNLDASTLEALEEQLIMADMGADVASAIAQEMRAATVEKNIAPDKIKELLAVAIAKRFPAVAVADKATKPRIILMVGVNGNGKTTTVGKLAHQHQQRGETVMMVAADTFRAAAVEQLEEWAKRAGCIFVRGAENADPAAVAYQGVERAIKEGIDTVFVDTAGRLHTKQNLMDELAKIIKVIMKLIPDAPHEVLQVIDATTGQNAIAQIKAFREVAGVTGLVVTKLDGTAKAGIVVAIAQQFKLPIIAIGVGEGAEDLQAFEPLSFSKSLVGAK
jgi:fused signal recognition particle receptor